MSEASYIPIRMVSSDGEERYVGVPEPRRGSTIQLGDEELQVRQSAAEAPLPVDSAVVPPEGASIAVLPFDNMGQDPDQEYFSDGLTEDLITDLAKLAGVLVIARNSVFTYKGKPVDVQQVGKDLGVRTVLEGSVRKAGSRVRITAQLIDVASGGHL